MTDVAKTTGWVTAIDVEGAALPAANGVPFQIFIDGNVHPFVPIFSTVEKLHAGLRDKLFVDFMASQGITDYQVKQVSDAVEFCNTIWLGGGRIMFDPYRHTNGKLRWTEPFAPGTDLSAIPRT